MQSVGSLKELLFGYGLYVRVVMLASDQWRQAVTIDDAMRESAGDGDVGF